MSRPIIILGAGGHASVVADVLRLAGETLLGLTDCDPALRGEMRFGLKVLGTDDELNGFGPEVVQLANGIGSIRQPHLRTEVFERWKAKGYDFVSVIHPRAVVAADSKLAEGVQIMAGAVVQPGAVIASNSIINTGAIIDHDCRIAEHCHVAPGAVLSGNVRLGARSHLGTGAVVIQGIEIGQNCLVGAGSVVLQNLSDGAKVAGVPARPI